MSQIPGVKGCTCNQSFNAPAMTQIPQAPPRVPSMNVPSGSAGNVCGPSQNLPQSAPPPSDNEKPQEMTDEEQLAKLKEWTSPLRRFDTFAMDELRRRDIAEEDFPKLKVPTMKGQHKCKVSCLLNHNVDYAIDMEQDLRNIGIQETHMLDMLEKLTKAEAAVRFQGAVRAAEVAAMSAPPDLAEEAAVAGARGYSVETQEFSKKASTGENPIEIIGYIGCTRPNNF